VKVGIVLNRHLVNIVVKRMIFRRNLHLIFEVIVNYRLFVQKRGRKGKDGLEWPISRLFGMRVISYVIQVTNINN